MYSPSHEKMMKDFFIPSFPDDVRLELKTVRVPQTAGDKPAFNNSYWTEFMKIKARFLYDELISLNEGEWYLFLDVDIINVNNFTDHLIEKMKTLDVYCQSDSPYPHIPNYCTGIIAFKNNERVRNLLKAVSMIMNGELKPAGFPSFENEQEIITFLIANKHLIKELQELTVETIPFDKVFTYGYVGGKVWRGEDENFDIPPKENLLWLHANYAEYEHKYKLLELFKEKLK